MDTRILPHAEERVGHVAVDMGFMTEQQVTDTKLRMVRSKAAGETVSSFTQLAIRQGYLDEKNLVALVAEEHRRRRLIAGYEIVDIIGTGAVASVYHARQLAMDRDVALKVLHPRLASDPVFVEAYIEEARAVSRFHHPNIVQGFDAGESNGFFYFAHEYMPGGSMADLLAKGKADFSERRLLMYLRQTTSALVHAWQVAVYHGDINPGNLLLDANGDIKLANLGVPRVTGTGPRLGSVRSGPQYAAPEQLDKPDIVNAATDMYGLGATFYHIAFGVPPFPGGSAEAIREARRLNPVPSFSLKRQEEFSGKFLRVVHDLLEVDPARRPANAEELAERLEKFHIADGDDPGDLASQVRRFTVPIPVGASSSQRLRAGSAPNADTEDRRFFLTTRRRPLGTGRGTGWILAALAAAGVAAAAGVFLS